jgi:acyl-CoA thioester hydrolase
MRPPARKDPRRETPGIPAPEGNAAFALELRVYYQDTDAGGVVFHAAYLNYFERARTEWLRDLGFGIGDLVKSAGLLFIVREIHVKYHKPALLDDKLVITTGIEHLGRAQFTLDQRVLRDQDLLVQGRVNLGCVSALDLKPARLPMGIRAALERSQGWPVTEEEDA